MVLGIRLHTGASSRCRSTLVMFGDGRAANLAVQHPQNCKLPVLAKEVSDLWCALDAAGIKILLECVPPHDKQPNWMAMPAPQCRG